MSICQREAASLTLYLQHIFLSSKAEGTAGNTVHGLLCFFPLEPRKCLLSHLTLSSPKSHFLPEQTGRLDKVLYSLL